MRDFGCCLPLTSRIFKLLVRYDFSPMFVDLIIVRMIEQEYLFHEPICFSGSSFWEDNKCSKHICLVSDLPHSRASAQQCENLSLAFLFTVSDRQGECIVYAMPCRSQRPMWLKMRWGTGGNQRGTAGSLSHLRVSNPCVRAPCLPMQCTCSRPSKLQVWSILHSTAAWLHGQ
jgi:hypothetical protein